MNHFSWYEAHSRTKPYPGETKIYAPNQVGSQEHAVPCPADRRLLIMHVTLTEHARCLYGDEYRPTPECDLEHREHYFVQELTFADADSILAMLRELSPHLVDGYLPMWIRNLAYRLVLLQRPDEPTLMREAADSLYLHGPEWDHIAADLRRRADALERGEDRV